jgi:hypothetical protein
LHAQSRVVQQLIHLIIQALIISHLDHSIKRVAAHNLCTADVLDAPPLKDPDERRGCPYFATVL